MALDLEDARRRYHFAFNDEDRARVPFYGALLRALERDGQALTLLAEVRVEQRNAMLILASLHLAAATRYSRRSIHRLVPEHCSIPRRRRRQYCAW
jgi:hypothetical protein